MKTDELINHLSAEGTGKVRSANSRLGLACGFGAAACLVFVVAFYGLRADLAERLVGVAFKAGLGALAIIVLWPVGTGLVQPNTRLGWRTAPLGVFIVGCIVLGASAIRFEGTGGLALDHGVPECWWKIPLAAIPAAAGLFLVARKLAPTRLTLAGAAIGALSASIAVLSYALYCPMDGFVYHTVWYPCAIAFCAAVGAGLGGYLLRW